MNAATVLLVLAAAAQTGWTPDRYPSSPSSGTAQNYDRYALPPSGAQQSRVAPPPGIVDRTRAAVTETGATLREGIEAGIGAANQQLSRGGNQFIESTRDAGRDLQAWTENAGRQFQSAPDNNLAPSSQQSTTTSRGQVTNPFATTTTPSAGTKSRGGVAPPPWSGASATTEPDWATDSSRPDSMADRRGSSTSAPPAANTGWTSIGSNVAAPPLLVPPLLTTSAHESPQRASSNDRGSSFQVAPIGREPSARSQDWSTGWGTGPAVQPVTIGRDGPNSRPGADREIRVAAQQPAVPRAQETRQAHSPAAQQSSNGWPDLFADNDLPELPQRQPASGNIGPPANQLSFPPNRIAANPATAAAAPSAETSSTSSTGAVIPASGSQPVQGRPTQATGTEQKWMPMLLVSLSLAGSLGANLFLGFSYLEARQKYASLVRKTANSFRRSASAA